MYGLFWRKTGFWGTHGPKMGCIDDKLILFSATDSRRTWLSCIKFTEISVQNQVGKKFSKTNVSKVTRWRERVLNNCTVNWFSIFPIFCHNLFQPILSPVPFFVAHCIQIVSTVICRGGYSRFCLRFRADSEQPKWERHSAITPKKLIE